MTEITDVWNTECALTNRVLSEATPIDLGLGEQLFLIEEPTNVGTSQHYYAQGRQPIVTNNHDEHGALISQTRQHSLELVFHQAEVEPPQGANTKTSNVSAVHNPLGGRVKEKVGWTRNLN
ncbi:MAG: hypothetical protein ACPG05_00675 [Bdellovibrionales bacterium]